MIFGSRSERFVPADPGQATVIFFAKTHERQQLLTFASNGGQAPVIGSLFTGAWSAETKAAIAIEASLHRRPP